MASKEFFEKEILPLRDYLIKTASITFKNKSSDIQEDFVAETLLNAYVHIDQFKEGTNIKGWLTTILRNVAYNTFRKEKSRPVKAISIDNEEIFENQRLLPSKELTPEQEVMNTVVDNNILNALGELKLKQRQVFEKIVLQGMKYEEVSKELKIPIGTVMSRMNRARKQLLENVKNS